MGGNNENSLTVFGGILSKFGATAETSASGREAVEKAGRGTYDLILLSNTMPDMNGAAVVREIRKAGYTGPLVAIFSGERLNAEALFKEAGADGCFDEPADASMAELVINKYLLPAAGIGGALSSGGALAADEDVINELNAVAGLDVARGLKTMMNSAPKYLKIMRSFVNMVTKDQGKMSGYIAEGDFESFKISVHGYKSALANIGAEELSGFARALEAAASELDITTIQLRFPTFEKELNSFTERLNGVLSRQVK